MILTKILVILLTSGCMFFTSLSNETIESLLKKHYEVIGDQALKAIPGVLVKGRLLLSSGDDRYFKMYIKGHERIRVEWSHAGVDWVEIYKEGQAWSNRNGRVDQLGGQDVYNLLWLSKFTSPLRDVRKQEVLLTESQIEGDSFYNLSVSGANSKTEYLIDKESYLLIYQRLSVREGSELIPQEIGYEKFKDAGGGKLATVFIIKTNDGTGEEVQEMIFDDLVLGYPVPLSLFQMPDSK